MHGEGKAWRGGRLIAGGLGLLFSAAYLLQSRKLDLGQMDAPGPGLFPLAVGILFALVSVAVMAEAAMTAEPGEAHFPEGADRRRLLIVAAGFAAYVLLLGGAGFPLATTLFVAFYARVVGGTSWLWSGVSGVLTMAAVWLVFETLLGVVLPFGTWWGA